MHLNVWLKAELNLQVYSTKNYYCYYYYNRFTAPSILTWTTQVSWYQKDKTNQEDKNYLNLLEQQIVSGTGIGKSAPRLRQITMPESHHSVFYRPGALPAAQPKASKHLRQNIQNIAPKNHFKSQTEIKSCIANKAKQQACTRPKFWSLGLLLGYLDTSTEKFDVMFLLGDPDFRQRWRNFPPTSLSFGDLIRGRHTDMTTVS